MLQLNSPLLRSSRPQCLLWLGQQHRSSSMSLGGLKGGSDDERGMGKGLMHGHGVTSKVSTLCACRWAWWFACSSTVNTSNGGMVGLFTHGADSMLTQLNLQSQRRILCYGSNRAKDSVLTRGNNIWLLGPKIDPKSSRKNLQSQEETSYCHNHSNYVQSWNSQGWNRNNSFVPAKPRI